MVSHPRASLGARNLRRLNAPAPVQVQVDPAGRPLAIQRAGHNAPRAVARVQDRWRIDDEWWRDRPVSRLYYTVVLVDGLLLTLYHDLIADAWFTQRGDRG